MEFQGTKKVISNVSPATLTRYEDVLVEIHKSLVNLRELAKVTDFDNANQKDNYRQNVAYLKQFYARAERLLINESQG